MAGLRQVPFNRPTLRERELMYISEALSEGYLGDGGSFTSRAEAALEKSMGAPKALLTNSCTAALEIAALLVTKPGDEIILPSFTFAATATAFVRCRGKLVFVDVEPDTFNIDPTAVQAAITARTRAIVAVHYAGVACNLAALRDIAQAANAALVEDAAQALGATYRGRPLGLFGDLSAFSFHATKNVTSGMGGALVVNNKSLIDRSQIIRDRGTDRKRFLNKEVDRYSWIDIGSAYAPSDLLAAFLLAQLEDLDQITSERLRLWMRYHESFEPVERAGRARRPIVPNDAAHNGHIYCLLLNEASCRRTVLAGLERRGVGAASHYVALHNTPAGMKFGRVAGTIAVTEAITDRIIRLPLHLSMSEDDQRYVIRSVIESIGA